MTKTNKKLKETLEIYLLQSSETDKNVLDLEPYRQKESMDNILNFIKEIGGDVHIDEMDTNGWQWDTWVPFEFKEEKYSLEFCGFYNNNMKICYEGDK